MAYAVTIPRHLAPTVGPSSAAGVFIRTDLTITTGERVASGLIWRFGSLDGISDNAGCFADRPFPAGGNIISFGGFNVYVATVASPRYPRQILRCASPPPGAGTSLFTASPCIMHEVMATGDELPTKSARIRGPELERHLAAGASGSGTKAPQPPSRLDDVRAKLSTPLTPGGDPATIGWRRTGSSSSSKRRTAGKRTEITSASTTAPRPPPRDGPSRAGQIRRRGRDLGAEIARDGAPSPAPSEEQPVYNTPDKNMRAAQATAEELNHLEGEELRRQTKRVTELLNAATRQAADPSRPPPSRNQEQDSEPRRQQAGSRSSGARQPARSRLGPRIEPTTRERLDRLVESRIAEEEAPAGPKCFGPRIINEPMIDGFQLPRDTPKYDGLPAGGLAAGLLHRVGIAKGNKRWAVRYSPLMLLGSACTWLNNLPAGSINGWLDFEAAFISNFTGTYRRPGRPQQPEMCKQGPDETDRAYLTRWCEMRNSCEGVHEVQAIGFFMGGCRPNTMLWHKLRRSDPRSMAALMAIADKRARLRSGKPPANSPAPPGGTTTTSRPRVARMAAGGTTTAASGTATSRTADRPWKPYTFEQMLDSACKYHSGKNPSNHTTRDCHFMKRLTSGEPLPPPPPPPPAGRWPSGAENANLEHHEANHVHHGRYLAEDATYIIFTSEPRTRRASRAVPSRSTRSYRRSLVPNRVRFSRVLVTAARINILPRHRPSWASRRPSCPPTVFHGIVPGHCCQPIGRITLEVMFGAGSLPQRIEFEVVDLVSPYHALGRPA
ncbi:hypothetical protein QYE76_002990 [Lolium multiflorum]|uniref:Retrotransposon gag domain-containing protein n=1 Tax=Lolium multiflorum TaxID=4521 RepID=A0AAD8RPM3_LOLMU|nr:hypothetical protein QYE76_002990 [Lolium multiflorum]